jgi:hypothetical protein
LLTMVLEWLRLVNMNMICNGTGIHDCLVCALLV